MHNSLIDVSVVTMIGNLPGIINRNNESIRKEFSDVLCEYDDQDSNPKLKIDVECNYVTAQTGSFQNLNFAGQVLNASFVQKFNMLDVSVSEMSGDIEDIKEYIGMNSTSSQQTYGSSRVLNETHTLATPLNAGWVDMSGFFTTKINGRLDGMTTEYLLDQRLCRTVDGVKIPLQIGTVIVNGRVTLMLYHDHVTQDGAAAIQRIYVSVCDDENGTAVVQAAPAHTVMLSR